MVKLTYVASGVCCGQGGMKDMVVCAISGRSAEVHSHVEVVDPCIW